MYPASNEIPASLFSLRGKVVVVPADTLSRDGYIGQGNMMKQPTLETLARQMRDAAVQMVPFSYPRAPASYEEFVYPLRMRQTRIDGYRVLVSFGIADHGHHMLESVQAFSCHGAFLPFSLVVKIGSTFLGKRNLSLMEMFQNRRKVYCWTVYRDTDGNPCRTPFKMDHEKCVFEGFEYDYVVPQHAE